MVVYARAPARIFAIGNWTDTALAGHGMVLSCVSRLNMQVTVRPRVAGVHVTARTEHGPVIDYALDGFCHVGARHFTLAGAEIDITQPMEFSGPDLMASLDVAVTGALAMATDRCHTPHHIGATASRLALEELGRPCGMTGHIAAAVGGITLCRLDPYPRVTALAITLDPERLQAFARRLIVLRSGRRPSPSLYARLACQRAMRAALWQLRALPQQAAEALIAGDFARLGEIMNAQHATQLRVCPALATPEVRHITALAGHFDTLGLMLHDDGAGMCMLCAPTTRAPLETALREAGYTLMPVHLDPGGLRAWRHDSPES